MRTFVLLCAVALRAVAEAAGETGKVEVKCDVGHLEKAFGMTCKAVKMVDAKIMGGVTFVPPAKPKQFVLTLEFGKDVEDTKTLQGSFTPAPRTADDKRVAQLWFYLFDQENVVVTKAQVVGHEGEISGKKGDAIRVFLSPDLEDRLAKVRKIEVRPVKKDKS